MKSCTTLIPFLFFLCCQIAYGSPIVKGVEDIYVVSTYLPSYATVLISFGALLLLAYFILGCVCCPNKSIKALSYQNGFPVSRLNENNFENPTEITIFPPHSTVIDLQPVNPSFPGFDEKITFEPLPDILPKSFTTGQSAACSSRPAHFSALLKSKVSLHDWFDDPNSNFPREQLQYLQEIGIGWFGRVVEGEASQICDNEEKTTVIVKILREEASPSEHLHFLHEVRPYRDLKHSNVIKLLGRCLESDPFLLILEHSTSDLKTYLSKQERENFLQDGLILQMISNIASGLRYMHDKGFCHMDLAAHNCFVCNDNSVKIGDYGISFDRWRGDYYCLGDIALPIRWYSPEILMCSETTIETKEITREANVWAFGVVLWEIAELGKLPYENLSDEEVLQKVLIEKCIQLLPPTSEILYKDEIVLVMRECWKPRKHRPSMEKIENFIMQLYNDRLSIKKQELSFEERWNSIQPRITEISSYTGTESSSLKFENDFSVRSDLQNYSSDNEILSSFEMSFDILPKTGFNGQLSPSLNVLNGSIDELTEDDVYLNSISLSCGKYDADTLSNISDKDNFQMEEDKENSNANNVISDQISAAIRDLDLVLASQPDSSRNSTLQKTETVLYNSGINVNDKEFLVNGIFKESEYLSKSSDLSNISESSFSKSSNFSEHVDHVKVKCNDLSVNSDLNGNCNFYDNVNEEHSDVDCAELTYESDRHNPGNIMLCRNQDDSFNILMIHANKYDAKQDNIEIGPTIFSSLDGDSKIPSVPDIVIHESPSEVLEENAESESNIYTDQNQKSFRFVFKDIEESAADTSHQDFGKELVHDLTETLKQSDQSKPLTSTPVKSSSDSVSPPPDSNMTGNNSSDDVFCDALMTPPDQKKYINELDQESDICKNMITPIQTHSNSVTDYDIKGKSSDLISIEAANSINFDHFTTAQSSLLSKVDDLTGMKISQNLNEETYMNHTDEITSNFIDTNHSYNFEISSNIEPEKNTVSSTANNISKKNSQVLSDVISPPNGYLASQKDNYSNHNSDIENEYLEDSKASETVSPPQAFQDGLAVLNDSCSESKTSFDQDLSTSAECGSSENLDHYLEDDHISHGNISAAKLLETSFPDMESKSFTYETGADFSGNMRPRKNNSNFSFSDCKKQNSKFYHSDYESHQKYNLYDNAKAPIQSYDQMIVEDLNTGEQTIINESYSVCDDYENSGESDEILKINTETDEAIIVDSSEALIGFVPSRSIELLQEFEVIPPLNPSYTLEEEKESSDSMNIDAYNSASPSPAAMKYSSPYESPEIAYPQPYRNFCLQNEVIEEEITDEIVSPSSFHSSSSYCSNEIFMDEEKMSQSSESAHQGEMYETSVLPSMEHLYVVSDDGSKTDVSSSECSPVKQNGIVNASYRTDAENNHIEDENQDDVMHSYQPTQSVRWLSDEMLDVDSHDQSPIIIEGREILAGDIIQTCELTAEDIATALSQLETKGHLHGLTPNHLNISHSPSPFSSVESSPCRDTVYTPDFESDSEETGSGTSCSSTSGSFECIHNKFKNTIDISKVADESDKSASSREQSPMKIFSKTWDCHATPTRGVLVTPEKKFNSMRKSVSFHEEDPHVVFEYPPASDSSEDGYPSDDNEGIRQSIDYLKYADWDLQVADADDIEAEEIVEIEELDSEPYVRRPSYSRSSVGPLNRPMLYTLTAGFSDEDFDISETVPPFSLNAPSNSPDEDKSFHVSANEISEMIEKQLHNQTDKENQEMVVNSAHSQNFTKEDSSAPTMSVQESVVSSVELSNKILDELLQKSQRNSKSITVQRNDDVKSDFDEQDDSDDDEIEEVIVEELSEGESESDSFEFNKENRPVVIETDNTFIHDREYMNDKSLSSVHEKEISHVDSIEKTEATTILSDINDLCNLAVLNESQHIPSKNPPKSNNEVEGFKYDFLKKTELKSELNTHKILSENVQNIETNFKNSYNSETVLNEDCMLLNDSALAASLVSIEENFMENTVLDHIIDNATKSIVSEKSHLPDITDSQFNLTKNPVHIESLDINSAEKSTNNSVQETGYVSKSFTEISCNEVALKSQSLFHSNIVEEKEEIVKTVIPNSSESCASFYVNCTIKEANESASTILSTDCNENPKGSKSPSDSFDLSDKTLHSVGTDSSVNQTVEGSESLVSDNSALINNLHDCSISVDENVAQNTTTQLINSSSIALADLSEVFFTPDPTVNKITDVQSSKTVLHISDVKNQSESPVNIPAYHKKDTLCNSVAHGDKQHDNTELLSVPKIIVTPASESEVEDELEEYLREQLEHLHSEASPQEDFSVTSEYSCRPFDDVFGSYISGDSSDYIEAFNFEFENGNFFDDYIDDYPHDLQTDESDRLYPDGGQQKRSSSLPVMTENVSDDDSLTVKSDSSLIYDSSKGITRL